LARLAPLRFVDEFLDPLAELERLIHSRTCEVCGDVWNDILPRYWKCRKEKKAGYVSKHWRNWRLCPNCLSALTHDYNFASFIFPVIANMPPMENLMEQLVAVQPMQAPAPGMFYLDYVIGPEGVRRMERRDGRVLREDHIVRGRTRHVAVTFEG